MHKLIPLLDDLKQLKAASSSVIAANAAALAEKKKNLIAEEKRKMREKEEGEVKVKSKKVSVKTAEVGEDGVIEVDGGEEGEGEREGEGNTVKEGEGERDLDWKTKGGPGDNNSNYELQGVKDESMTADGKLGVSGSAANITTATTTTDRALSPSKVSSRRKTAKNALVEQEDTSAGIC